MQSEIPVAPLFVFIYFYTHKVGIRAVINQEDFIRRLQQREKEAFQELFYSWHRPLCFFASRIIKDQDVAEDLVQDVFVAFVYQCQKRLPELSARFGNPRKE